MAAYQAADEFLKTRLQGLILKVDSPTLRSRGVELLLESRVLSDLVVRRALLAATECAGAEELKRWEEVLVTRGGTASAGVAVTGCIGAAGMPVPDRRCAAPPVPTRVPSVSSWSGSSQDAAQGSFAASFVPSRRLRLPGGDRVISQWQWLAVQQELRMKDFVVKQLERQLGFEQGCDDWIVEEVRSSDELHTETAIKQPDNQSCAAAEQREEENRCSRMGWWQEEAQSIRSMYDKVEQQSSVDEAQLNDQDKAEYFAKLRPMVQNVVHAFKVRRVHAEQVRMKRWRHLQQHQEKLRRRMTDKNDHPPCDHNDAWGDSDGDGPDLCWAEYNCSQDAGSDPEANLEVDHELFLSDEEGDSSDRETTLPASDSEGADIGEDLEDDSDASDDDY